MDLVSLLDELAWHGGGVLREIAGPGARGVHTDIVSARLFPVNDFVTRGSSSDFPGHLL